MRALKLCSTQGCINLIRSSERLCPQCRKERRLPDNNRPPSSQRGYDAEWRKIRDAYLARNQQCVNCGRMATDVDHITPLSAGGTNDWDNLQALCKRCHSKKTAKFDGAFGRKRKEELT